MKSVRLSIPDSFSANSGTVMMRFIEFSAGMALVVALAGCSTRTGAPAVENSALGQKFILAQEPAGALGIIDYRESETPQPEVTLVGRIGGGNPTWSSESASFLLSDPAQQFEAQDSHVCKDDNCPFCKGKKGEDKSQAIVMLTDGEGRVPAMDARKLLPLVEGQMVVVSGNAEVNALGQLIVHARGLYVRR